MKMPWEVEQVYYLNDGKIFDEWDKLLALIVTLENN